MWLDRLVVAAALLQFLSAGIGVASVVALRRPSLSKLDVLCAGPLIFLTPGKYVSPGRETLPRLAFGAFYLFCAVMILAIWADGNL